MIHFEEKDRQAWLAFLTTDSGAKGLAFIREQKVPVIRPTGEPHEMHFDAGKVEGFRAGVDEVEALSRIAKTNQIRTADRPPLAATRRE